MTCFARLLVSLLSLAAVMTLGCGGSNGPKEQGSPPDPDTVKKYEEFKSARPKGGMGVPAPPPKFFPPDFKGEEKK
jgi:hypothetical protein